MPSARCRPSCTRRPTAAPSASASKRRSRPRRRVAARAMLTGVVIVLVFGAVSVILWIGGHDVISGRISAGALSALVFYALVVGGAAGPFPQVLGRLAGAPGPV